MLLPRKAFLRRRAITRAHRYTGPSAKVRKVVHTRAAGQCEFPGCARIGTEYQHRLNRKAGGRHRARREQINQPAWLLLVCRTDHQWVHDNPASAYDMGWLLREHEDAADIPVAMTGGAYLLGNDGGKEPML